MTLLTITNTSISGNWNVVCSILGSAPYSRQGGSSASASSGGGGWQVVDRSRQKAATEWLDYYPIVMTGTCLLDLNIIGDTSASPGSVEGWISTLESFEAPVPGTQPPLPPILTLAGPVPHTDLFWVCSRLEFAGGDTGQIRNAAGDRIQQGFTIELTEYSPSTAISTSSLSPAQQAAVNGSSFGLGTALGEGAIGASGVTYVVNAGDTLQSIAAVHLGNVSLWPEIALLNGLSNSAILSPGQSLQLPA